MKNMILEGYGYALILMLTFYSPTNQAENSTEELPVIKSVSSDQNLDIENGHEKVTLACRAAGQNITGGHWERIDGDSLPTHHNTSTTLSHHHNHTITFHLKITKARPIHSGLYHCIVYNHWGTVTSRKVKVNITIASPQFLSQPNNKCVVALNDAEFICTAKGYKTKFQWKGQNSNETIGNHPILTINNATPLDEGQYYCIASNDGGSIISNKATLTVNDYITTTVQSRYIVVAQDESAKICVVAEGPGKKNFTYNWSRVKNIPLPRTTSGEDTQNLMITSITSADSGEYYCVVTNQWGSHTKSDKVTINVLDIILHPQNETVATGQTIVLTCMVYYTGMDDITYQWTKTEEKNVIVPLVAYDSNLTIYDTNVNDTGMYNCIAFSSSSNTSIKSNTASVSVLALPVIIRHPSINGSITVPEGNKVVLTCEATGEGTLNYQWIRVSGSLSKVIRGNTHLMISNVTVNDTGVYYCSVNNGGTSVSSKGVQVIVKGRPKIINISEDQSMNITSKNEKVTLICIIIGDDIIAAYWMRVNGALPYRNNHSSFDGNQINLTVTKVHPYYSGNFFCVIHSLWGMTVSTAVSVVIVAAPPTITYQPTNKIATALSNVTLTCEADGFDVTYEWRHYINNTVFVIKSTSSTLTLLEVTPSDEGEYGCVAITGHGRHKNRVFTDNVTMTVDDSFIVKISQYPEYMVVINESVTFNVSVEGLENHNFTYQWHKIGDSLPKTSIGQDTQNFIIPLVTPSDSGSYYCNVTNQWGKSNASNSEITKVQYFTETSNNTMAAQGSNVVFKCNISVPDGVQCKWKHNGEDLINSSMSLELVDVDTSHEGTYTCMIMRNNHRLLTSTAKLEVLDAILMPLNGSVDLGSSIDYTCKSSTSSPVTYQWLHNGTVLENDTNAILSIRDAKWRNTGVLCCIITASNNLISAKSNCATLTVLLQQPLASNNLNEGYNLVYLISLFLIAIVFAIGIIYCCSKFCKKSKDLSLRTRGVASVVEMTNQTGQSAATGATVTTTLNNSNSSINTNGNNSGNNSDNGDSDNDNGDDIDNGSGDNNDNINGNINNDSDSNDNGDNNDTGNIINDNDIGGNNNSGNIDNDNGSNDTVNNNDNNSDDNGNNDNDNNHNCNDNDDNMSSRCNNTSISSTNSSACIKKQTGQIHISNNGTNNILDIIIEINPDLQKFINITELLPYLKKHKILTAIERENLELKSKTDGEKIQDLLSQLHRKAEIGHENFIRAIYESSKDQGNSGHCEIIKRFESKGIYITESEE